MLKTTIDTIEENYQMKFQIGAASLLLKLIKFMNDNEQAYIEIDDLKPIYDQLLKDQSFVQQPERQVV